MPELPEVETMVRGIRSQMEGARIEDVILPECSCRPILMQPEFPEIRNLVTGSSVKRVFRRAKRVVIELDHGLSFVIEPRMTGLMIVDSPPSQQHLRFQWKLRRGKKKGAVWFWDRRGLGTLRLLSDQQMLDLLGPHVLGPDALEMNIAHWRERLSRTHRPVKVVLLDQKMVAGIGNLYASEILHRAGIHPECVASEISTSKIRRLHAATLEILSEAIEYEGSTLGDGTYRNALNKDGGYQNKHRVYAKAGETCPTCSRGKVQRIVQAQRSTFFCGICQKKSLR
ncbi:bifunctional DNA-formamidopyrimidine glycosylase/DNA-(apurinic or apyrimidinic site) lyase [Planctomicrobium sp. SH668]|uniref:bifunctional DNA-formamidopyrimidine glycosylase/DNA-(apurinic or apyrimidinic site) lyase n=1 Tax=Planctomicrobium sp. SH668 TaxID=3448126 RepID=UPI003F5B94D3